MKRTIKIAGIALLLLFCFTTKIFALGAGAQIGCIPGLLINQDDISLENMTANITGTFKMERVPLTIGSGLEFGKIYSDSGYGFSLFADYRTIDVQLINTWNFFSGFGASIKFLTSDFSDWNIAAGARFFAGMNWLFYDGYMEIYLQQNLVPTYIKNLSQSETEPDFMLCLPFEAGIRLHF